MLHIACGIVCPSVLLLGEVVEECLVYICKKDGKAVFYGHDTGVELSDAPWALMAQETRKVPGSYKNKPLTGSSPHGSRFGCRAAAGMVNGFFVWDLRQGPPLPNRHPWGGAVTFG